MSIGASNYDRAANESEKFLASTISPPREETLASKYESLSLSLVKRGFVPRTWRHYGRTMYVCRVNNGCHVTVTHIVPSLEVSSK